jgi:opacity protein-like surface antigen
MRHVKLALAAAALLAVLSVPAFSQIGITLGAFGGTSVQTPSALSFEFDTDTTFVYGLRAGLRILMFGVELNYFQAAHNILVGGAGLADWDEKINDYSYVGINGKVYFPILMLQPFVTAGYGYYTADIQNIDKDNDGGLNIGAGLDLRLGKRFSLTAEGRWQKIVVSIQDIQLSLGDWTFWAGFQIHL